jgi:hypothetical protein
MKGTNGKAAACLIWWKAAANSTEASGLESNPMADAERFRKSRSYTDGASTEPEG